MFIELDRASRDVLTIVVEGRIDDLKSQIRKCSNKIFRKSLKAESSILRDILDELYESMDLFDKDTPLTDEDITMLNGRYQPRDGLSGAEQSR